MRAPAWLSLDRLLSERLAAALAKAAAAVKLEEVILAKPTPAITMCRAIQSNRTTTIEALEHGVFVKPAASIAIRAVCGAGFGQEGPNKRPLHVAGLVGAVRVKIRRAEIILCSILCALFATDVTLLCAGSAASW